MAKLQGGLLGSVSGKVAGLVAFSWKNIQAVRAYVKPANPQTDAQTANRTQFKDCSMFGLLILGAILQEYMDTFIRGMSAYNWFIKQNKDVFDDDPDYTTVQMTHGTLFPAAISGTSNVSNTVTITFATALGSNGLATDKVYACVYSEATGGMSFAEAEVLRSAGTIDVVMPAGASGDYDAYLVTLRRDADTDAVTKVGDSQAANDTIA